jgi:hypothetical protein
VKGRSTAKDRREDGGMKMLRHVTVVFAGLESHIYATKQERKLKEMRDALHLVLCGVADGRMG